MTNEEYIQDFCKHCHEIAKYCGNPEHGHIECNLLLHIREALKWKDQQFAIERLKIGKNLVCRMRESMQVLTHAAPIKDMDGKELKPVAALEYAQSIIDEVEAFVEKERNKQYEFMKGEEWK